MSQQGVTLHLTEPNATRTLPSFDGLPRERMHGASRSHLELVIDHVSKTLVVYNAQVDVSPKLLARDARVHRLVAHVVVAGCPQLLAKV